MGWLGSVRQGAAAVVRRGLSRRGKVRFGTSWQPGRVAVRHGLGVARYVEAVEAVEASRGDVWLGGASCGAARRG